MAVKKRRRGKVVDKWKAKTLYQVVAPDLFQGKELGYVAANEDSKLIDRVIRIGMSDVTGSFDELNMYTMLRFRITDVKGTHAYTSFDGHELSRAYVRTLTTRRHSLVDPVVDVITKDEVPVRVKGLIITAHRVSSPKKTAIRKLFEKEVTEFASSTPFNEFMNALLLGKFGNEFSVKARKIVPIRTVRIRKTEVKRKR